MIYSSDFRKIAGNARNVVEIKDNSIMPWIREKGYRKSTLDNI